MLAPMKSDVDTVTEVTVSVETAARAAQGTAKKATRKTFFFKREPFSA